MEKRWATYEKVPIICKLSLVKNIIAQTTIIFNIRFPSGISIATIGKLADFGESRSVQIQTAKLHSTTKRVDRQGIIIVVTSPAGIRRCFDVDLRLKQHRDVDNEISTLFQRCYQDVPSTL